MEQKQSSSDYVLPLTINGLFIVNIVLAIALANEHQRDGYLGGFGYIIYAGLSIVVSAGVNLCAFLIAYPKQSTAAKVIYGVAALAFSLVSAWVIYSFAHISNLKPGG